jgi:quercetin dioxygenase-like cupin family protein
MENVKLAPTTVNAQDGQTLSVVGDTYRILLTGEQTGGSFAAIDMLIPPNGGPGPHAHAKFQESFYVMEGEVEFKSEISTFTAKKGSFVNIPLGGIVHSFKNKADKTAHLFCFVIPAGLEAFFKEIGEPVSSGAFLPPPQMTVDLLKKWQEIAEKYGQKIFPPDYFG